MSVELRREINAGKALFEQLVLSFGMRQQPRFTQDSPVRTSVWTAYADDPEGRQKLILVPNEKIPTPATVETLLMRLQTREISGQDAEIMALPTSITATLGFDDLLTTVLPMTSWWHDDVKPVIAGFAEIITAVVEKGDLGALVATFRDSDDKAVWRFFAVAGLIHTGRQVPVDERVAEDYGPALGRQVARWRFIRQMADILIRLGDELDATDVSEAERRAFVQAYLQPATAFLGEVMGAAETINAKLSDRGALAALKSRGRVWSINLNRPLEAAVARSRRAVKADAAAKLFDDDSDRITWAVVDSGIDATHVAFRDRSKPPAADLPVARGSRIRATYDFDRLRALFSGRYEALITAGQRRKIAADPNVQNRDAILAGDEEAILAFLYRTHRANGDQTLSTADLAEALSDQDFEDEVRDYLESLKTTVIRGRMVDWPLVEPLIAIPHDDGYAPPAIGHGTHVAGTLMGDIRAGDLAEGQPKDDIPGVCPKMRVFDLRVTNERGGGEEFVVQAALQFVGHLNRNRDQIQVHGINISLSLTHDVANYACGLTPVCLECERLIGDGVVVVAAAGNKGFQKLSTENGLVDAYNPISITDPGNAEGVITVGATHRDRPHSYGVSYFSSRGPTGDGRQKPDLVAPGEKIVSALPGNRIDRMDGTSMAAPHVSGAAAMLMARHSELIGRPDKIKAILCDTATDLNRRREFQGAGLLDILRALQSV